MGNAQEAIEDYENRNDSARRLDAAPTPNPDKCITMVLDFKYKDGILFLPGPTPGWKAKMGTRPGSRRLARHYPGLLV